MKTKLIIFLGIFCLALSVQAIEKKVIKGQTFTELGDYVVQKNTDLSTEKAEAYVIKYENSDEEFIVMVCQGDDCKNYIVYGNNLDLQYIAKKNNVFGLCKTEKKFRKTDKKLVAERIDREQYFRQKVISTSPKSEKEYLGLIACYLPQVIS